MRLIYTGADSLTEAGAQIAPGESFEVSDERAALLLSQPWLRVSVAGDDAGTAPDAGDESDEPDGDDESEPPTPDPYAAADPAAPTRAQLNQQAQEQAVESESELEPGADGSPEPDAEQ